MVTGGTGELRGHEGRAGSVVWGSGKAGDRRGGNTSQDKNGRARSRVPEQKFLALPSCKEVQETGLRVEDEGKVSSLTCTLRFRDPVAGDGRAHLASGGCLVKKSSLGEDG